MRTNHLIVVGALSLMMGACFQTYQPEGPKELEPPPPHTHALLFLHVKPPA